MDNKVNAIDGLPAGDPSALSEKSKSVGKLIKEFRNGDRAAIERLMSLLYKDLYSLAYDYLRDKMLAEDVVSETFIKLIEKAHTIKDFRNLNGYIRTIVINKSLDVIRKRRRELVNDEFMREITATDNEEQTLVRLVLFELSDIDREILLLWHYGFTLAQISQKTNYTVNQVRLLLSRAKENFSKKYHKLMPD